MVLASVTGLLLLWSPWRTTEDLGTAISVQLANGDGVAAALFVFMAVVLVSMAVRLWRASRKASACLMAVEAVALGCLAVTSPASFEHLAMFVSVAVASAAWLAVLSLDLEDGWLKLAALTGFVALFVLPHSLGYGERILVTSCLSGMNLMFFRHFG